MIFDNTQSVTIDIIQKIRIEFLGRIANGTATKKDYSKIIQYLSSPTNYLPPQEIWKNADLPLTDLHQLSNEELRNYVITKLYASYKENPKRYENIFTNGQYIIWQTVLSCAENLVKTKKLLEEISFSAKKGNYPNSCSVVKEYLSLLAESYRQITIFEKKMGVDRYLATSGLKIDIQCLHEIVREIRLICNTKLGTTVVEFQLNWNITSVSKTIEKLLGIKIQENSVTNSMASNQDRVIFLLIDGFGYAQYLWYLKGVRERKSTTYNLNIFEWLSDFDEFNDDRLLATTLVSDTGSALSAIFSGKLPSETGIYASKILHGNKVVKVKSVIGDDFLALTNAYPNTFLDDLSGVKISIIDGGGRKPNYNKASFSGFIYSDKERIPIKISERVFKKCLTLIDSSSQKQLHVAYLPLIDNTGHSIGAFTSFESYEYEKLNILLVEFLLNLGQTKEEIFDGKTTIVISADHGMFETSIKKFTMDELKSHLSKSNLPIPQMVNNNRAVLFYKISGKNLELYRNTIEKFLNNKQIDAKIVISTDEMMTRLFNPRDRDCPSMVLLIRGDGFAMDFELEEELLHHGGHGGCSCEEVFVPLISLTLTPNLHRHLIEHFAKLT